MKKLGPRHYLFIKEYLSGKNETTAAKLAGFSAKSKAGTYLLKHPLIIAELEKATTEIRELTKFGAQKAMVELNECIEFAESTHNATARVKAVELKMKLSGLLVERIDQRQVGSFQINIGGIENPPSEKEVVVETV